MELLAGDASLCRALGQAAAERVRSELTWPAKAGGHRRFLSPGFGKFRQGVGPGEDLMTMRDYFDRVRVINLPDAPTGAARSPVNWPGPAFPWNRARSKYSRPSAPGTLLGSATSATTAAS